MHQQELSKRFKLIDFYILMIQKSSGFIFEVASIAKLLHVIFVLALAYTTETSGWLTLIFLQEIKNKSQKDAIANSLKYCGCEGKIVLLLQKILMENKNLINKGSEKTQ